MNKSPKLSSLAWDSGGMLLAVIAWFSLSWLPVLSLAAPFYLGLTVSSFRRYFLWAVWSALIPALLGFLIWLFARALFRRNRNEQLVSAISLILSVNILGLRAPARLDYFRYSEGVLFVLAMVVLLDVLGVRRVQQ